MSRAATHLDSRPLPFQCLFQVKTIKLGTRNVSLRLSAERLAKSPIPSFLIVLLAQEDTIVGMHIQHIIDRKAERILKALHACELQSSLQVNKREISFSVKDLGRRLACEASELKRVIKEECVVDPSEYTHTKFIFLKEAGFDTQRLSGSFSISTSSAEDLRDFLLGRTAVEATSMTMTEYRWGIPRELNSPAGAMVEVRQTGRKSTLKLRSSVGLTNVNLAADVYIASNPSYGVSTTIRAVTEVLDVEMGRDGGKITFLSEYSKSTPISLKELIRTNQVFEIIACGEAILQIHPYQGQLVEMSVSSRGADAEAPTILGFAATLRSIKSILQAADFDDIITSQDEIRKHFWKLTLLGNSVMSGQTFNISIGLKDSEKIQEMRGIEAVEGLFIDAVRLERHYIAYYCVGKTSVSFSDPEPRLRVDECHLRQITILAPDDILFENFCAAAKTTTGLNTVLTRHTDGDLNEEEEDEDDAHPAS